MYFKRDLEKMEKGFYPSLTRLMDGQNRASRRRADRGAGAYKVGAMVVIGSSRFRYRCQRVFDKVTGGLIKKIYHFDVKGSNW